MCLIAKLKGGTYIKGIGLIGRYTLSGRSNGFSAFFFWEYTELSRAPRRSDAASSANLCLPLLPLLWMILAFRQ
jgi:hypothetical protein